MCTIWIMPAMTPVKDIVIFCGGRGTRLSEKTREMPKPLIELGDYPIIWHIMKNFSHYGMKRFILTLGYKGEMIIDYFMNRHSMTQNFSITLNNIRQPRNRENWDLEFVHTGLTTKTALRLYQCRDAVRKFPFIATYGDGVADINVPALARKHVELKKKHGVIATVTITRPYSKYGIVKLQGGLVDSFREKPLMDEYINVGYMVFEKEIFNYLDPKNDVMLEETLELLAEKKKLGYYIHDGFWHAMDTYKDYIDLNEMWREDPQWKIWND